MKQHRHRPYAMPRPAFTLVETAIALVLVGGLIVVSLNTVGQSTKAQANIGDRGRAQLLAADLLNEIMELPYQDPTEPIVFGIEPLEGTTNRTGWDDVDDYRNYSTSPPKYRDGSAITDMSGWTEQVNITRVLAASPSVNQPAITDTGVKRITVTIKKGTATLAVVASLKARTTAPSGVGGASQTQ